MVNPLWETKISTASPYGSQAGVLLQAPQQNRHWTIAGMLFWPCYKTYFETSPFCCSKYWGIIMLLLTLLQNAFFTTSQGFRLQPITQVAPNEFFLEEVCVKLNVSLYFCCIVYHYQGQNSILMQLLLWRKDEEEMAIFSKTNLLWITPSPSWYQFSAGWTEVSCITTLCSSPGRTYTHKLLIQH